MPTLAPPERAMLAATPVVARLDAEARAEVMAGCVICEIEAGEHVVRYGDEGELFFVLLSGELDVYLERPEGGTVTLSTLTPGAYFGEQALLGPTGSTRTASVRATVASRCVAIPRALFVSRVVGNPANRAEFDRASVAHLRNDLLRALDAFRGLELEATTAAGVERVVFEPGETILVEGDAPDAVYFILDGVALAVAALGASENTLRRIGAGQCFGELGVLTSRPRSATVRAESRVELLRIEAATFRRWVAEHPQLRDFLGTLQQVYPLKDGRMLSVYRCKLLERDAISTVYGDPAGDCVVSTKIIGEDVVVVARGGAIVGEEDTVTYTDAGGREIILHLAEVTRSGDGGIDAARLVGVMATTAVVHADGLYRQAVRGEIIRRAALERFRKTGTLGGDSLLGAEVPLCRCLGLQRDEVVAAAAAHGYTVEAVQSAVGAGIICGTCGPAVEALLDEVRPRGTAAPQGGFLAGLRRGLRRLGRGRG